MGILNHLIILNRLGSSFPGSRSIELGPCSQLERIKLVGPVEVVDHNSINPHTILSEAVNHRIFEFRVGRLLEIPAFRTARRKIGA